MIKDPKYVVKFINTDVKDGVVFYYIQVLFSSLRFLTPSPIINHGSSKQGTASYGKFIRNAKLIIKKTNCRTSRIRSSYW